MPNAEARKRAKAFGVASRGDGGAFNGGTPTLKNDYHPLGAGSSGGRNRTT